MHELTSIYNHYTTLRYQCNTLFYFPLLFWYDENVKIKKKEAYIGFRVTNELYEAIQKAAAEAKRKPSDFARLILEETLLKPKKK